MITPRNKVLAADVFEATSGGSIGKASALSMVVMGVCALGMLAIFAINSQKAARDWLRQTLTSHAEG